MRAAFVTSDSTSGRTGWRLATRLEPEIDWVLYMEECPKEKNWDVLVSFLSPVIIPKYLLSSRSYNIHPSTPEYPGRDPQNWAMYEGTQWVGATLHRMIGPVDAGEILDVIRVIWSGGELTDYIAATEALSLLLLSQRIGDILDDHFPDDGRESWGKTKHSRADFERMKDCTGISAEELVKRIRGFHHPEYKNLFVRMGTHRFYYGE